MKRRDFLKSMTAVTASRCRSGAGRLVTSQSPIAPGHRCSSSPKAGRTISYPRSRRHQRPGYEASWNCYDRLI